MLRFRSPAGHGSVRTGSTEAVAVTAVFLVAVVGAAGYFFLKQERAEAERRDEMAQRDEARAKAMHAKRVAALPAPKQNEQLAVDPATVDPVAPQPVPVEIAAAEDIPKVADDPVADPRELVRMHLEVGEFGPAIDVARTVKDFDVRGDLMREVAKAQAEAGEFGAALYSIRAVPDEETRAVAARERAEEMALAGGAANADFDSLIDLIIRLTGAPESWEDQGGPGSVAPFQTGVRVDPNGHLSRLTKADLSGRLERLALVARDADLNDDMARPTDLRFVSLTRLEREVSRCLSEGRPVPTTMQHFAGLSRIQYVFVFPEEGEIVVGGPAEAWRYDDHGAPVGVESGRPTLRLDDFVTVARVFQPRGQRIFTCSIVPRQENIKTLKDFVESSNAAGPLAPGAVRRWAETIGQKLGTQDVVYEGLPANSRVANVLLEADYRMKLIGIGKVPGVGDMQNFFDLLPADQQRAGVPMDALRWWLTMKYDAVLHSPGRDVFEVRGSSVLCRSENELIADNGGRVQTGKTEETNRLFAEKFTANYAALAERDHVFADLQNVFDLSLLAALVQKERLHERCDWDLGSFASGGAYQPADVMPILTCDSAVNFRVYRGKHIVVQAAGGVRADLWKVVNDDTVVREQPAEMLRATAPRLPENRWWWDAH